MSTLGFEVLGDGAYSNREIIVKDIRPRNVMVDAEGDIYADPTGKAPGRGAYVCDNDECRKKLNVKKLLHKTFSTDVSLDVYQDVEKEQKS